MVTRSRSKMSNSATAAPEPPDSSPAPLGEPAALPHPPPAPASPNSPPAPLGELFQLDPSSATNEVLQDIVNLHIQWILAHHPVATEDNVLLLHNSGSISRSDANRIYSGISQLDPEKSLLCCGAETLPVLSQRVGQLAVTFLGLGAFRLSHKRAEPARYRFALTDIISDGYDLVVEDNSCRMEPAVTAPPHVSCRLDAETFVLMGVGRLQMEAVIAGGRLTIEGDRGLAQAFITWVKRS